MYCKKNTILSALLLLAALLSGGRAFSPARPDDLVPIDRIVAVVNQTIITRSDVERSRLFFPWFSRSRESDAEFQKRVLKDLIDHRVIYLEYSRDYQLNDEDYERVQIPVIQKFGSLENLSEVLGKFGMNWQDFKDFIREKALYEKIIVERFRSSIPVSYREISAFYENEYVAYQKRMDLPVKPLVEIAPTIETYLRNRKIAGRQADWLRQIRSGYRIENKLEQDEYGELPR